VLGDTFTALGESAGAPALLPGQPGGASGNGVNATSGASSTPEGGASGDGTAPIGGVGAGAQGGGGVASSSGDGEESGAAGSAGSAGTSDAVVWNGDADSSCSFAAAELLTGFGLGSGSLWGSALARGSLTLLFASRPEDDEEVFETSRPERGTRFEPAVLLQGINTASNEGTPFLTPDALSVYFYSNRAGGAGNRDLYVATRSSPSDAFVNTERLANVNGPANDHLPRLSGERTLVFTSTRSGQGGADLWLATRDDAALDFGSPVPLPGINTSADEEAGQLSADQLTLVFDSDRSGGIGGHDIWFAAASPPHLRRRSTSAGSTAPMTSSTCS
jgi:hypothetical protein